MKEPTFAPGYVAIYPVLAEIANKHGYSLAVHGSVSRDFDLIACPWVETATTAEELMNEIALCVGAVMSRRDGGGTQLSEPSLKPHGRRSWAIPIDCGAYLDLSVMPLRTEF